MNDTELKRIEKELGIRLPAPYTKILREFPDELRNWPEAPGADRSEWFFADAERVIEVNRQIREHPGVFVKAPSKFRKSWPPSLFVFGRYENNWHVVDVSLDDPPLMEIVEGEFSEEGSNDLSVCFNLLRLKHATEWQKHRGQVKQKMKAARSKPAEPAARSFTHADLQELERQLEVKLPAAYRSIVREFPEELRNWPDAMPAGVYDGRDDFLLNVAKIVKLNKSVRRRLRKDFPPKGFVFGGRQGGSCWLIDTGSENPAVQLVHKNDYILSGFDSLAGLLARTKEAHQQAWTKAKQLARTGAMPALSADDLIAEGRRLARPAVALRDKGSKCAAVWRGSGVVSAGQGEWRHRISIDASFLPDNPRKLKGVVSVYEWFADDNRMGDLKAVHDPKAALPRKTDGIRLYAKPFDCPPPVEAVFQFGSKNVKDWAKSTSWDPNTSSDESPVREYAEFVGSRHPFASDDGTYAMLGGWSAYFGHCYGMDEEYPWRLLKKALIVLTIAESEPWIEVFDDGRKFVTFSRIT